MKIYALITSMAVAAFILGGFTSTSLPASAQYDVPPYTTWQPGWDAYQYDRGHVLLGRVSAFTPYRLSIMRHNGNVQTIDLKHGTEIYPTGATPTPGEHVALVGYYSNGTFIANRVIIRM